MKSKLRRNRIISKLIILLVFAFILLSLLICCGNGQACYQSYTVQPGDTLYGLHAQYGQAMKYHTWAAKMYRLNNIEVGQGWLYEGQKILIVEAVR